MILCLTSEEVRQSGTSLACLSWAALSYWPWECCSSSRKNTLSGACLRLQNRMCRRVRQFRKAPRFSRYPPHHPAPLPVRQLRILQDGLSCAHSVWNAFRAIRRKEGDTSNRTADTDTLDDNVLSFTRWEMRRSPSSRYILSPNINVLCFC